MLRYGNREAHEGALVVSTSQLTVRKVLKALVLDFERQGVDEELGVVLCSGGRGTRRVEGQRRIVEQCAHDGLLFTRRKGDERRHRGEEAERAVHGLQMRELGSP